MATMLAVTLIAAASAGHAQTDRRTHMNLAWSPDGKRIAFSAYINFKPRFS
ncbi:MAG: hypothetical protein ABIQ43_09450 [Sphingomonas sp.]